MDRIEIKTNESTIKTFVAATIYAVAMGYLESAVVIYLRQTTLGNYQIGPLREYQVFPIRFIDPQLGGVELVREGATIIMLLAVGYLAGRNRFQRIMFFVYSFAVWDIFYYAFLKLFTGWPSSLGDFDVLFLIPVIWVSPVACPILISLLLTSTSAMLIFMSEKSDSPRINFTDLFLFLIGSATVFYSFTEQIFRILIHQGPKGLGNFTPTFFDWPLFFAGYFLLFISAVKATRDCYHKMTS